MNRTKLQIVSDLHLEFPANKKWLEENPLIPKGDILLLAGDIVADKYKKKAQQFYKTIEQKFYKIISTMGNHEFYNGDISYAYPYYSKWIAKNHVLLNNKSIVFNDVKYIVSILWSFVPPKDVAVVGNGMNDYNLITKKDFNEIKAPITVADTNKYHQISMNFIKDELEKPFKGKIVVMSHHLPSFKLIDPKYSGDPMNSAFASNLDELILSNPQIVLWVCGHSHKFFDIVIGSTRVIANPLGYVDANEHTGFKRNFCVEI